MSYTQKDIDLLFLKSKQVSVSVTLLDDNYMEIEQLTGKVVSASYNCSSSSNIRRTCSITLAIPKKEQIRLDFRKTWIKRMVELKCGFYDRTTNSVKWYSLGRMLMKDGSTSYGATTQEVKLSLVDLMSSLTEDRGSPMGTGILIPVGTKIKDAIIGIVTTYSNFKLYDIRDLTDDDVVPYDIEVERGRYPYELLQEILQLYPYYEMFYSLDGKFTVQKIPTKTTDPIEIPKEIIDQLLISENNSIDFSRVKNTTEIWGKSLDAMYTASKCKTVGSCYNLTIDDYFEALVVGETYSFVPDTTSVSGQTIKIQDTTECKIYVESGSGIYTEIEDGAMQANIAYCVRYADIGFVLQGELTIHVIVQEIDREPSAALKNQYKLENNCRNVQWVVNPDSPFAATINAGQIDREIKQVFDSGEFANIYTTELAFERAKYENWVSTRLQDSIDLEMILIPWMETNDKIEYTSPSNDEVGTYLVQDISYNFSNWTMSVNAIKFYPLYPWD